jgi:hypothetical protein
LGVIWLCLALWPPPGIVQKECAELAAITKMGEQMKNPSRNRLIDDEKIMTGSALGWRRILFLVQRSELKGHVRKQCAHHL